MAPPMILSAPDEFIIIMHFMLVLSLVCPEGQSDIHIFESELRYIPLPHMVHMVELLQVAQLPMADIQVIHEVPIMYIPDIQVVQVFISVHMLHPVPHIEHMVLDILK